MNRWNAANSAHRTSYPKPEKHDTIPEGMMDKGATAPPNHQMGVYPNKMGIHLESDISLPVTHFPIERE
jgi:hypothetical protein